ncbi:MAG: CbiX/SirB N-terminal domain-containing protein [Azoarcus sp.]|jgi:sirohydrochlorin cobaltochelatase|nr:CbiX/SirB N-terminal domain-containing protein [Azoarcus sp.]
MSAEALILLGHGARDPAWAQPLQRIREQVCVARPGIMVEVAFLELLTPLLEEAVAALVARGAECLCVLPVFLASGRHLKHDLPRRLDALGGRYPGCALRLAAAVGENAEIIAAIAAHALMQLDRSVVRGG